ncbi:hypothetical protein E2562_012959 [Oryza meyeriana var. granulata]|uniref:Uncharacterized protein n=1 Tax=Oryza meyeriana var. granulata TaxID=110450 RepID=A0A6G1DJY0_9ORYZ|nr:hypothetical protein E2562_012959 [Oryza meyeriana var. granulata]
MADWSTQPAEGGPHQPHCPLLPRHRRPRLLHGLPRRLPQLGRTAGTRASASATGPCSTSVFQTDARLFVNTATGRSLRKDLPLLRRRHHLVASAPGGDLVLAEASPPHAVRVLNPFTGAMTRFAAPVPSENGVDAHVIGASPTFVLLADSSSRVYFADPESEGFIRLAVIGGLYAAAGEQGSVASILLPEPSR